MEKSESFKPRTDEIEDWRNRAKEALDLAQIELESGYYWGVVGRSYYAAFYIVKALLLSYGEIVKTHKGTLSRFFELFVKTDQIDKDLGRWFSQAMESRNEVDYDVRED